MIKVVIFDLWNTLAKKENGVSRRIKEHFGLQEDNFVRRYEQAIQLRKWDSLDEMSWHLLKSFGITANPQNLDFVVSTFKQEINNSYVIDGIPEVLSLLKKKYLLAIVSNTTNFEVLQKHWSISDMFDIVVYSWQTSFLKPDFMNFGIVQESLGVLPDECILVDDSKENVFAAVNFGMGGILFKSVAGLNRDFHGLPEKKKIFNICNA